MEKIFSIKLANPKKRIMLRVPASTSPGYENQMKTNKVDSASAQGITSETSQARPVGLFGDAYQRGRLQVLAANRGLYIRGRESDGADGDFLFRPSAVKFHRNGMVSGFDGEKWKRLDGLRAHGGGGQWDFPEPAKGDSGTAIVAALQNESIRQHVGIAMERRERPSFYYGPGFRQGQGLVNPENYPERLRPFHALRREAGVLQENGRACDTASELRARARLLREELTAREAFPEIDGGRVPLSDQWQRLAYGAIHPAEQSHQRAILADVWQVPERALEARRMYAMRMPLGCGIWLLMTRDGILASAQVEPNARREAALAALAQEGLQSGLVAAILRGESKP